MSSGSVDVIDHHNLPDDTSYKYDVEIPFEFKKEGTKLAWIEPYFGDLSLTGSVVANATRRPGPADLAWEANSVTRGWIEAATGNLYLQGQVIEDETDYSETALGGAIDFRHYNQPLAYLDSSGNFHLKGRVLSNQSATG